MLKIKLVLAVFARYFVRCSVGYALKNGETFLLIIVPKKLSLGKRILG